MSEASVGERAFRDHGSTMRSAVGWLGLAAAPVFALMAVLSVFLEAGASAALCATAHASPLTGMAMMYALMSAFHLAPWLRLTSSR